MRLLIFEEENAIVGWLMVKLTFLVLLAHRGYLKPNIRLRE